MDSEIASLKATPKLIQSNVAIISLTCRHLAMPDELDKITETTSEVPSAITDVLSAIDGIALPPVVKRSFWKALSTLITGIVDVPAAWLESKSQVIRDDTAARSLITIEAAKASAKRFSSDEQLIQRSIDHFGARILKEQKNRESVAKAASKELAAAPPDEDTDQEIDEDWLDMFSGIAEKRSNKDMQLYLAKLLAEEVRKPGSFAPSTVEVLAKLTPTLARTFQSFCNISVVMVSHADNLKVYLDDDIPFVLAEPYGYPGDNALADLGFSYSAITHLQDAGLVQHEFNAYRELHGLLFALPIEIGGTVMNFATLEQFSEENIQMKRRMKVINLTTAGMQIRRIIDKSPNEEYVKKLQDWVSSTYSLAEPT